MLAFDVHVLGRQLVFLDHFGKSLDHDGLRRDGVGRDHLRPRQAHALGERLVTG